VLNQASVSGRDLQHLAFGGQVGHRLGLEPSLFGAV